MDSDRVARFADDKDINSFLRERFLYSISSMCGGKDCKIKMYSNTEVTAKIKSFDYNFENVFVENLITPYSNEKIKMAILRTSDILTISLV